MARTGQLGIGDVTTQLSPQLVVDVAQAFAVCVGCGAEHTAVVTAVGTLYTWGEGKAGKLCIDICIDICVDMYIDICVSKARQARV